MRLEQTRTWALARLSLSTELACNLLKVLASRGKTVGVAPLCTVTAVGEEAMVDDLSASGHVLNMFEVVGKIGRLIAWVKFYFCPARSTTSVAKDAAINASLAKALTTAGECVQEAKRMAAGATPPLCPRSMGFPGLSRLGSSSMFGSIAPIPPIRRCAAMSLQPLCHSCWTARKPCLRRFHLTSPTLLNPMLTCSRLLTCC